MVTKMIAPRTEAKVAIAIRIESFNVLSSVSILKQHEESVSRALRTGVGDRKTHSFEKRFIIRPRGVVSKNDIGANNTPVAAEENRLFDAL